MGTAGMRTNEPRCLGLLPRASSDIGGTLSLDLESVDQWRLSHGCRDGQKLARHKCMSGIERGLQRQGRSTVIRTQASKVEGKKR